MHSIFSLELIRSWPVELGIPCLRAGHKGPSERKEQVMEEKKQRTYTRLVKAERTSIERDLDGCVSARSTARDLGRSPASVVDKAKRNRTVTRGSGKGERVEDVPETVCPKLEAWPWVRNGCKLRRYHCSMKWACEYSAMRARALADNLLASVRRSVNAPEESFEDMMVKIRSDVARGPSPAQIVDGRADGFRVHPTTIYRWIAKGYGGTANAELRRQVGYKPRKQHTRPAPTFHGPARSYAAFLKLSEEKRARAAEMDCVIGRTRDPRCLLALFLRLCKVQVALLLAEKTSSAVAAALDMLERVLGKEVFQRLFGLILADNGIGFADTGALERSAFKGVART